MLERHVEQALVDAAKLAGGWAPKWVSPGHDGVPDRIVLMPGGRIVFVELKAPGERPTPLQAKVHEKLTALGFNVDVIDSVEDARAYFI